MFEQCGILGEVEDAAGFGHEQVEELEMVERERVRQHDSDVGHGHSEAWRWPRTAEESSIEDSPAIPVTNGDKTRAELCPIVPYRSLFRNPELKP